MGRPAFQPTNDRRRQVADLHDARVSGAEIARRLGISKPTLWKHFRGELGILGEAPASPHAASTPAPKALAAELPLFNAAPSATNAVREAPIVAVPLASVPAPTVLGLAAAGSFRPTLRQRKDVEVLTAYRMPPEGIAADLGLSVEVLKEHFAAELQRGSDPEMAALLKAAHKAALGGNVSMMRLCLTMMTLPPPAANPADKAVPPAVPAMAELGKKIQQLNDAKGAGVGTDWGDDLRSPALRLVSQQ